MKSCRTCVHQRVCGVVKALQDSPLQFRYLDRILKSLAEGCNNYEQKIKNERSEDHGSKEDQIRRSGIRSLNAEELERGLRF